MHPSAAVLPNLSARRILVVEDEYLVARYLTRGLAERGAVVVGPAARVEDALALIDASGDGGDNGPIDGAILDVTLADVSALPIADRLLHDGVPFVFASGYDRSALPSRFAQVTLCVKTVQMHELIKALSDAIDPP